MIIMKQNMKQDNEFTGLERELWDIAKKTVAEFNDRYNGRNRHQQGKDSTLSQNWKVVMVDSDDDADKA